ncbi:MAG TPA: hypothetical protein VJ521_09875, partial [Acidobacteriota bacterium]|nr:hypothetical protein [Acidobacteriota bacterium]
EILQTHLQDCQECRQLELEFRGTLGLMQQLPQQTYTEPMRIRELLRGRQMLRTILFSKAALWILGLSALLASISYLPVHAELSANSFSLYWGDHHQRDEELTRRLKEVQAQLANMQKHAEQPDDVGEVKIRQLLQQNNAEQEKRYWQTLQMFTNYLQYQRKADLQRIQHEIASTYNRTGQEMEKTNELLNDVLRVSTVGVNSYDESN